MKIINRGFMMVTPTDRFDQWAKPFSEESHLIDTTNESSCYLIEEDFWEEDLLLEKYYKKISKQEFYPITQDAENWPLLDNPADFMIYFNVQFGTFVYDLLVKDLLRETI
jgi:hypothetical protein